MTIRIMSKIIRYIIVESILRAKHAMQITCNMFSALQRCHCRNQGRLSSCDLNSYHFRAQVALAVYTVTSLLTRLVTQVHNDAIFYYKITAIILV